MNSSRSGSEVRGIRWWPAVVVLVLAALALIWVWGFTGSQRQDRVISTVVVMMVTALLLLLWLVLLSRMRWMLRLALLVGVVLLGVLAFGGLRIRGVTGDLVPIFEWSWSPSADAELATVVASRPGPEPGGTEERPDGASYPQYLGPSRDGTLSGAGLGRDWKTDPPALQWRQPIGAGWSAFAVLGSFAVTLEQRGSQEMVTCYELTTGKLLWAHAGAVRFEHPVGGIGPRATPAIDGGRVYALGATGTLSVLELASGALVWSTNILEDAGVGVPEYGVSGSPLVDGDRVVVAAGGRDGHSLMAYDKATGEKLWAGGNAGAAYSSPLIARLAGVRQILLFGSSVLTGHDAETGAVLWSHPWPSGTEKASQPVVLPGDRVFLSSGYGVGGKQFAVRRDDAGNLSVELVWETRGLKAKFTNVVYHEGYLYGLDDGILVCLDPADGSRKWKRGRYGHGQVILADDLLIVQGESGDVALVEANPQAFRELGRIDALDGKTWNHPALAGRLLLVRNDQQAACYRLPGA